MAGLDEMFEEADQRWPGTMGLGSQPEPRHEDTARHWRANAAEEKRKKQHISKLLAQALKERDAALERAERLEKTLMEAYRLLIKVWNGQENDEGIRLFLHRVKYGDLKDLGLRAALEEE